jgi:hypothetical protein
LYVSINKNNNKFSSYSTTTMTTSSQPKYMVIKKHMHLGSLTSNQTCYDFFLIKCMQNMKVTRTSNIFHFINPWICSTHDFKKPFSSSCQNQYDIKGFHKCFGKSIW